MKFLLAIRYVMVLPLLILTLITTPAASSTDTAELIGTDTFVADQAFVMGQGIATDGKYYYTSGSLAAINTTALAKFTVDDMSMEKARLNPLPDICEKRGNNHIGGISYYNGKIYASVEGGDTQWACIVVFDADTLKPTGEIYDLPNEKYEDGVPWCAVDPDTGYLYASMWDDAKTIYVYDVNNGMAPVKELKLTGLGIIDRIQGGEFLDGTLYLSHDIKHNGNFKRIESVNVETGEVKVVAERNVGSDNVEAEGMTFTKTADGAVMHVLDYNKLIGVFVHHYKVDF